MKDKEQQTAIDFFFEKIKKHFVKNEDLFEELVFTKCIAKSKERNQHGNTWNAAIESHHARGLDKPRFKSDFDDYEIK